MANENGKPTELEAELSKLRERVSHLEKEQFQYETLLSEMCSGFALHEMIFDDEGEAVDYRFLAVNPAFERLTGLKGSDIVGRTVLDALPGTEIHWIRTYGEVVKTGKAIRFNNFSQELGSYYEVTAYSLPQNKFVTIFTDVSEYKKVMLELRRQTVALEQSLDGICIADLDGNIIFVNQAWVVMHGFAAEELIGQKISVFHTEEQQKEEVWPIFEGIKSTGSHKGPVNHVTKDGREFPTRMSNTLLLDEDGNPLGVIGIAHDITEERKLEEELRQAQKMEAVGTLAGGIAHEFNNILYAIFGFADLIDCSLSDDDEAKEYTAELFKAANRAKALVGRILEFSREQEGDNKPLRLANEVHGAVEFLRPAIPTTINIEENIKASTELVLGDTVRLRQLMLNLGANAAQAMADGGLLEISLDTCQLSEQRKAVDLPPGEYFKLIIKDTGTGMDQETKRRIFDPFFTTKDIGDGTGLGLTTVHSTVKSMKGAISVHSSPGEGAEFQVYLPVYKTLEKGKSAFTTSAAGGSEKILLVDDEELIVQAIGRRLRKIGYDVFTERSAKKALDEFLKARDFDMVITDLTMPMMSGLELIHEIRQKDKKIPIILCTGYGEIALKNTDEDSRSYTVVMKPVAVKDLTSLMRQLLDLAKEKEE